MWFLHKKVILTKDKLVKHNWQGCVKCCFCYQEETIQHLFISCPFTRMIWRIVYMAFNIRQPSNITNLFGNWLNGVAKKEKSHIEFMCVLCFGRYEMCVMVVSLTKKKASHHFCRLFLWLCIGSICTRLCILGVQPAQEFYSRCGWRVGRRLTC